MAAVLRALHALLLLAGFYLLGFAVLGVLLGIDIALLMAGVSAAAGFKLYALSVVLAIPVIHGMFQLRTPQDEGGDGLLATEAQHPELWRSVRALAEKAGTRAPDEILLTGDANASVAENSRLLGLLPGTRRMRIGVPLMMGLSEPQLIAVLGHELGHYSHADTRVSGITVRGRHNVVRTIEAFEKRASRAVDKEAARQEKRNAKALAKGKETGRVDTGGAGFTYRMMAKPFMAYGKFYLRATHSVGRRQELAADRFAARMAGRDVTASALREIPVVSTAFGFYMDSYATLGAEAGLLPLPGEVFGGLRHLMSDPSRAAELAGMRAAVPAQELSPYDSHPPMSERVALIEALPDDGHGLPPARPSLMLLQGFERILTELEGAVLTPEALAMERADWPQLVNRSLRIYAGRGTEPLLAATASVTGAPATLDGLLWAIDNGRQWSIGEKLPRSAEAAAASGRAAREFFRPRLRKGLHTLAITALADAGQVWWELSWSDTARLRMPAGHGERLDAALNAAVADHPNTGPLRALLATVSGASAPAF